MDFETELLAGILSRYKLTVSFSGLESSLNHIVEMQCFQILQKIHSILKDDNLNDAECFMKIEEIVCLFEKSGVSCGNRHDFG